MNNFTALIKGPKQWTHPEVKTEVYKKFVQLQTLNPKSDALHIYNASVEIIRNYCRVDTRSLKIHLGLK